MTRKEGFIDLDEILNDIGLDKISELKEMKNNPSKSFKINVTKYIKDMNMSINFTYLGKQYFYKYYYYVNPYNELLANELAKDFGLQNVEYDLAILNDKKGVLSKNFRKDNTIYIKGADLLYEFWQARYLDKHNNLYDIWDALEYHYRNHSDKRAIVEHLMNKIVFIFIFDIINCQSDRHCLNWEIAENENNIDIAPLYDNENILCANYYPIMLTMIRQTGDNLQHSLDLFLKESSVEYKDLLKQKMWIIDTENLKSAFKRIEEKTCYPMPEDVKEYYLIEYEKHRNLLKNQLGISERKYL